MDVIAAIATGSAAAAIGIVRVSGDGCHALCGRVFRAGNGESFAGQTPRKLVLGEMLDRSGRVIDQGLAAAFPAGGSYTGEESAEFYCHGSPVVLQELLQALFVAGARQAKPGEFTKRAFLNGRMDLTAAEAVADLIDAETAEAARNAAAQVGGALARSVEQVYGALMDIASRFYAVVDYPDEDIEPLQHAQIARTLAESAARLRAILATAERGRVLKRGVAAAIVGRPNVGKSSLLNALAGYDRAIVTDVAGTTRDTVEEKVLCGGVLLRLIDTAGIRETADAVEKIGVERSRAALAGAELVLAVLDSSAPLTAEDEEILLAAARHEKWILVWSKCDLPTAPAPVLSFDAPHHAPAAIVEVSAHSGAGLDDLERAVAALYPAGTVPAGVILTNSRQSGAVARALDAVTAARQALESGMTPDVVLTDAEEAMEALGELTGRTVREDLVETIFSRFCVGK